MEINTTPQRRLLLPNRLRPPLHQTLPLQPLWQPTPPRLDSLRRPKLGWLPHLPVQRLHPPHLQLRLRRRHHQRQPRPALERGRPELDRPSPAVHRHHRLQAILRPLDSRERSLRHLDWRERRGEQLVEGGV